MKKRILITGASGFIGSTLAELCVELGYNVKVFDRYNFNNDWGWLEKSKYKNDMEIVLGDIRDYDSVTKAIKNCDSVFHLAALIGIPYSYISPLAYIRTNIEGTYNVLESSKNNNINQLIITSTSETYGTAESVPINEKHRLFAQSPYASTKIAADQLSLSYFSSFNLPVKIIRPFNTYGPRQSSRAIIPTILSQCLNNSNEIKVGNLKPTRDFTFVNDICRGFIDVYNSEKCFGEIVNIGSGNEISVMNIINSISKILNIKKQIKTEDIRKRPKSSEVDRLVCDNNKIKKLTTWTPKVKFDDGLSQTIEWFKKNNNLEKSKIYHV